MSNQSQSAPNSNTQSCPYCQRRFATLDHLNLHIVTRHMHSEKKTDRAPAQSGRAKP
jgi:glutaredoxin